MSTGSHGSVAINVRQSTRPSTGTVRDIPASRLGGAAAGWAPCGDPTVSDLRSNNDRGDDGRMLPRTTPRAVGVDPRGIRDFVAAAADRALELHSLMVVRRGQVVAAGWWQPYAPNDIALVYSLSKAFTTTAVGIAVGQGLLGVDAVVADVLGDRVPRTAADWVHRARVRDLLAMASGHEVDPIEVMLAGVRAGGDPLRTFLELPAQHPPGEVFTYNQGCTLTLAAMLGRITGERLVDWLRPRLFDPLGIDRVSWTSMPGATGPTGSGIEQGFTGIHVTTEAVASLGELWRCEGVWGERRILPAEYVAQARSVQIDNRGRMNEAPDWQHGYGYQLWIGRHGYRGDGAFGQFVLVLPEQQAVVALTAQTVLMQHELDLVWEHLLPAFGDVPETSAGLAADPDLDALLAELRLDPPAESFEPGQDLLDVTHPVSAPLPLLERVESVRLARDAGGLTMTWHADGADHQACVGLGRWARGELPCPWSMRPAVAAAAQADTDSVTVRVIYLESPHSLTVTLTRDGAGLTWTTQPLG